VVVEKSTGPPAFTGRRSESSLDVDGIRTMTIHPADRYESGH